MASNTYSPTVFATIPKVKCSTRQVNTVSISTGGTINVGAPIFKAAKTSFTLRRCSKTSVSCSIAKPETLQIVQSTIAKQLSIDENTLLPGTKFVDLGADSLDTVEIMMALEETFGVSVGEGGAENIATVQDAADLIEKVKADTA